MCALFRISHTSLVDLYRPPDDVPAHSLAPPAEVVGDEESVVGRRLLDRHVMGRQYAGGDASDVAPRLAVIPADREIVPVPRELGVPPAELLRDAHPERRDQQAAAELDEFRVDDRAAELVQVVLVEGLAVEVLESAAIVHPEL